ncbi:MAG: PA14 domain-containing protein [Bacillota bacterium]
MEQAASKESAPKAKPAEKPQRIEGLRAEYYAGYDLNDLRLIRIDPKVHEWWAEHASPDRSIPENFSVRWTGQVQPAHSETYTFRVGFDSGGRFWLNNRLLVDHWNGAGTYTTQVDLKAGQPYDLRFEFRKGQWGGNAKLFWQSEHQAEEAIPAKYLTPPPGTVPPTITIRSPHDGDALTATSPIRIQADAADADGSVARVEFFINGRPLGTVQQSPWQYEWKSPSPGNHKLTARAVDNTGISTTTEPCNIVVGGNANGSLPGPWIELPVGKTEPLGAVSHANGTFVLTGRDGDLWGERDLFYYVCQPLKGDGTIVARLNSFEAVHGSAAVAGLLIREHLANDRAKQAILGLVCDSGLAFVHRDNAWADPKSSTEDTDHLPCWLKLSRFGSKIRAYRSDDGKRWELLGERRVDMPKNIFVGLAIANPVAEVGQATFDQVSVTLGSPPMESIVKGVTLLSGSTIVGEIHAVDDTSVRMGRPGQELVVPTSQVARLLVKPLTSEAIQSVQPGRTGVILTNGDFVDGTVTFKDGQVRVSSVLFGMRRFNTWDETIAAVLHEVQPAAHRYEVRAADGSLLNAKSLAIDADKLKVTDPSDIAITLRSGDVVEIKAVK